MQLLRVIYAPIPLWNNGENYIYWKVLKVKKSSRGPVDGRWVQRNAFGLWLLKVSEVLNHASGGRAQKYSYTMNIFCFLLLKSVV